MPGDEIPGWIRRFRPDPQWTSSVFLSREDFPLLAVEVDHANWIDRLTESVLAEPDDCRPPPPLDHRECRFGRWYASTGWTRYGELPSFRDMAPLHERVHRLGRELLKLHADGRVHEARSRLHELHALRDQLLEQLRLLQADASLSVGIR
jgi:hypothetical protein